MPSAEESGQAADAAGEQTHLEHFDFADLRFIKSSRMSKRWIVFALRIKVEITGKVSGFCQGQLRAGVPTWHAAARLGRPQPHSCHEQWPSVAAPESGNPLSMYACSGRHCSFWG